MTLDDFLESLENGADMPDGLSQELKSLWLAKKERWEDSHNIAQDIPSAMGSRIHGLLHAIEGDLGNAGYWYSKAGVPAIKSSQIDTEWLDIVSILILSDK